MAFSFWRVSKLHRVSQFLPTARQDVQPLRLCVSGHYIGGEYTYKCYSLTPRKFRLLGTKPPNKPMTMTHLNTRYNSRRGRNRTLTFAATHKEPLSLPRCCTIGDPNALGKRQILYLGLLRSRASLMGWVQRCNHCTAFLFHYFRTPSVIS